MHNSNQWSQNEKLLQDYETMINSKDFSLLVQYCKFIKKKILSQVRELGHPVFFIIFISVRSFGLLFA